MARPTWFTIILVLLLLCFLFYTARNTELVIRHDYNINLNIPLKPAKK